MVEPPGYGKAYSGEGSESYKLFGGHAALFKLHA